VVVVSSALLVSATNWAAGSASGSFLFGTVGNENESNVQATGKFANSQTNRDDLAYVPLGKAINSPETELPKEEVIEPKANDKMAVATVNSGVLKDPEEEGGVKMYVVQDGDTVSSIAAKNHITVNTILWSNEIDNVDSIMPGDTLFILPVAGLQYTVKKGDNLDAIASKYKADKKKIISFNDLTADGSLEDGEQIIIPDAQKEMPPQPATNSGLIERRQYASTTDNGTPAISGWSSPQGKAGSGHSFPYGYCTWYVAQKRYVPWGGNAGTWLYHAKSMGYSTGRAPRPGAIMVTTESRYYGHVALVEKVNGGTITVSEMNYVKWGKVDRREISASSRVIKGYIYY
jgi:N-acetylmuramoyl-L-alanine amidase